MTESRLPASDSDSAPQGQQAATDAPIRVLVVGDWVVDEHWVTRIHRSPTSSRTGQSHYRALHAPGNPVQSLGGAGQVASMLHGATSGGERAFEVFGLGAWAPADGALLTAMLDRRNCQGQTPYRLWPGDPSLTEAANGHLFNLADILPGGGRCTTTRAIRLYQPTGARTELLQRIDWETEFRLRMPAHYSPAAGPRGNQVDFWLTRPRGIGAIVVKDLCKGVLSTELISYLLVAYPRAPWFISTKAWLPRWFDALQSADIRMLIVPQVAAQSAIAAGTINCWLTKAPVRGRGKPSWSAIRAMDDLARRFPEARQLRVVVQPEGLSLLAAERAHENMGGDAFAQTEEDTHLAVAVPMASALLPALVARQLRNPGEPLGELMRHGLSYTRRWMRYHAQRIERPDTWEPANEPILDFVTRDEGNDGLEWRRLDWERARAEWGEAFSGIGVITGPTADDEAPAAPVTPTGDTPPKKRLELSRAMTEVNGYACIVKHKRQELRRMTGLLRAFRAGGAPRRNTSCLVVARPGSGKTHLVRSLAQTARMRLLYFNITQMLTRGDLLESFDTIVTSQAQSPEENLLVCVDEVNAKLDNQFVYDAFLGPLEEGAYVRAGRTFHIAPCVWMFVGTETPTASAGADKSLKASDFMSRLTAPLIDLEQSGRPEEERLERIYQGAALTCDAFPDVRSISESVLKYFGNLSRDVSVRALQRFVAGFVNIQGGEVRWQNAPPVPPPWSSRDDYDAWREKKEGDQVVIVGPR